jgi:hypothetical protein
MFYDKIVKLNRKPIAMIEKISVVFQFLSLIVKTLLIKNLIWSSLMLVFRKKIALKGYTFGYYNNER